jgi:hypothetical protein
MQRKIWDATHEQKTRVRTWLAAPGEESKREKIRSSIRIWGVGLKKNLSCPSKWQLIMQILHTKGWFGESTLTVNFSQGKAHLRVSGKL